MIGWQERARRHAAPEYSHAMPNGFCLGGHSGRLERWSYDGSRWVAAEPSRYGFCVWGYDNDTPEVIRLGENLSGREVERLAESFLAVEEVALEAEGAKERLQRLFQSTPEVKENDQSLPLAVVRKERQRGRRSVRSRTLSPFEGAGSCAVRIRSLAQRGAMSVEASIWIASYLLAILGLAKAASSEQPLLWLAVWPAPVALASTIFIFFRQGFHFQNGVLVLGRRRG